MWGRITMPFAVYVLGLMIFSMTTSEFMVSGMMISLSHDFDVSIAAIGYLISAYAAGMIVGGPLLSVALYNISKKRAFLLLSFIFLVGQSLGAIATNYEIMMAARIITGVSSAACFGISLAICFEMVKPEQRGRAASVVLGGLMVATALGLPMAMLFDQYYGWRSSFWAVVALVLLSGLLSIKAIPVTSVQKKAELRNEITAFKNKHLWAAYSTSMLIIGATFSAFSYFTPILSSKTGLDTTFIPFILALYGLATIIGNIVTGRLADRYMMPTLIIGLLSLTSALIAFVLFVHDPYLSVIAVMIIGLTGVTMNPAMTARVARVAGAGTLVTTVHGSIISLGIVVGSTLGGMSIDAGYGVTSPLWVGATLGGAGLVSLLPYLTRSKRTQRTSGYVDSVD